MTASTNDANLIKEVMKLPENSICSDCDARDPDWVSINLGLFMCIKCSGVHRNLGVHISQVRSVDLDTCWTPELCAFMQSKGNVHCRKVYEQFAPMYYVRPFETESALVRENWIRAKYVRKEFTSTDNNKGVNPCIIKMPEKLREGWLMKANKKNVWQKRWFVLIGRFLEYYKSPDSLTPKGSLDLSTVSLKVPDTPDAAHRFRWEVKSTRKQYPMCAEREEEMFSWLHAIRRANVFYYTVGGADQERVMDGVTFAKIGKPYAAGHLQYPGGPFGMWVTKYCVIGPNFNAICMFKALAKEAKQPMDAEMPESVISLELAADASDFSQKMGRKYTFGVVTPGHTHCFGCVSQVELVEFMNACKTSMDTHNIKTDFDFQLNKVHDDGTGTGSGGSDAKSKPKSAAAAASPRNSNNKPATAGSGGTPASPKSAAAAASDASSDSGSGSGSGSGAASPKAASDTKSSNAAAGNTKSAAPPAPAASKAAPPIPAKGTKPPIPPKGKSSAKLNDA